jgi:isoquinoline 1-oxidoreductase beta subunit
MSRVFPGEVKDGIDPSSVEGAIELPYAIANVLVDYHLVDTGVPVGFWRSVGNSQNGYVRECFFDELAAAGKQDPLALRRKLMTSAPRLAAALDLAASKSDWGKPLGPRAGRGVACASSFGSHVAQIAEVEVAAGGAVRVRRVVCAVDCGPVVNPDLVAAQMEGAIVYGLSAALKSEITIDRGGAVQSNFDDYPLLRIDEMPRVEVHIVPSTGKIGGVGEPGTPPIAPAVVNAIFAATGKRVRRLPVRAADLAS